jgi:colanic acid biosynthesis glycosyl transferase WcaI
MRVLILSLYFAPDVAANAVIMTELAEELAALGHEVTVVTAFPHYEGNVIDEHYRGKLIEKEDRDAITIIRTYLYTSHNKESTLVRFLNYVSFNVLSTLAGLFSGPQDVVLVPSPPLTIGLSAFTISLFKGIPYVYNVQDIYPDVVIKLGILTNRRVIRFSRWLERFVYRQASRITVLSEGFKRNLLGKGVPEEKLTVIPNFVDTGFIRPLPRHNGFRDRFDLDGQFVALYAGNVGHSQDLENVLACAERFEDQDDVTFVVVGNGSRRPYLEDLAGAMELSNVRFIPFQPREDVPKIYAAADVCLVPLKENIALDSVPSKAYTIMASGRPIVASVDRGSDAWNLVEQAECGVCVEPEDPQALAQAIRRLYDNPDLRERLGRNGREHVVAHYTPKAVARRYDELLWSVVED